MERAFAAGGARENYYEYLNSFKAGKEETTGIVLEKDRETGGHTREIKEDRIMVIK